MIYRVDLSFTWSKGLKFKNCKVKYEHTYLTTNDYLICNNAFEKYSAKIRLLRCLFEGYMTSKDDDLKEFIVKSYITDRSLQENYIREVVYNLNTTISLKYAEMIFQENERILDAYSRYKDKDTIILKLILRNHLDDSQYSRDYYNQIIYKMPYNQLTIDTIIKYREFIFSFPRKYYGGS